jgi:hypothetical protein
MQIHLKKFMFRTGVLAALLFVAGVLFFKFSNVTWYHNGFPILLVGYLLFSWGIQYILYRYSTKRLAVFSRVFMLITGIKLLILIAVMVILAFTLPAHFKYFMGQLLLMYLLFSVIEIRDVLQFLKSQSGKN